MSDNVSWPGNFQGKHDKYINDNLPPAEKIGSQKELDQICYNFLKQTFDEEADAVGLHLVEKDHLEGAQAILRKRYGALDLDIEKSIEDALGKLF